MTWCMGDFALTIARLPLDKDAWRDAVNAMPETCRKDCAENCRKVCAEYARVNWKAAHLMARLKANSPGRVHEGEKVQR